MFAGTKREIPNLVPLLFAVVLVTVGAFFVSNNAINQILRAEALNEASRWGDYLVRNVGNIREIGAGNASPADGMRTFLRRQKPATIESYRFYDQNGFLRWDSMADDDSSNTPVESSGRNADAFATATTGEIKFGTKQEQRISGDIKLTKIMIPLTFGNKRIGTLEVVGNATAHWNALRSQVEAVVVQFALLIFFAFLLPGILYLRRSGQLEFTSSLLRRTEERDELTGALNRSAFTRVMSQQLEIAETRRSSVAVHFIGIDRFKDINDSLGHDVGDELLKLAGERIHKLLGTRERVARLGGDEFAISQPFFVSSPQVIDELAEDVVRELAKPFEIDGKSVSITASLGYAVHPNDGKTAGELVRSADIALYNAKERHRGGVLAFDHSMEIERQSRQHVEKCLRTALAEDGFELNYQPFVCSKTLKLRGFEALLRLRDEEGLPISPEVFIPIAEETGLIGGIGAWVLESACYTAQNWPENLVVSVNLSPAQFKSHNMTELVGSVMAKTGIKPERLELEVTESLLIDDPEPVFRELMSLKALGVSIALDDFGTGYSSLSYLWRFPFDKLKVDKSFMSDLIEPGSKSREILSTIIALGKVLDLKITAEGVESEEQAKLLRDLDCDLSQGYLHGRPMAAIDIASTLIKGSQLQLVSSKSARRRTA